MAKRESDIACPANYSKGCSPLTQLVWWHLDGKGENNTVPMISSINTVASDYRIDEASLSTRKTSGISTVLSGLEFIQASVYLSSNNLITIEYLAHFMDWINRINGRWILKALLMPRIPTTEMFATKLLPIAVRANDLEAVRFLLSVGGRPNTISVSGFFFVGNPPPTESYRSPLCEAIRNNNVLIVKILLSYGAEINPIPLNLFYNPTPLQEAMLLDNPRQIVEVLLAHGAKVDPELPPDHFNRSQLLPPLVAAVVSGNAWTVQRLLRAGADIDRRCFPYGTALQAAAASNNTKILKVLVHENADVNASSCLPVDFLDTMRLSSSDCTRHPCKSPLVYAVANGNMAMTRVLLGNGADINGCIRQEEVRDLLTVVERRNPIIMRSFWETVRQITNTPLQEALLQGNIELIQYLLEAGAFVGEAPNGDGLLQITIRRNNLELVELLLSKGAQVYSTALWPFQLTPVQAAAGTGNKAVLRKLLNATSDIIGYLSINQGPSPISGRTALQAAAENGQIEMVEFLLALGADVHGPVAHQNGITPLQAAAKSRSTVVARLLLSAGADIYDPPNITPALKIAITKNDIAMFKLFLQYHSNVSSWPAESTSSLLRSAADSQSTYYLQTLISRGINVNIRWLENQGYVTALETAVRSDCFDAVVVLLQAGAEVKAFEGHDAGSKALLAAVERNHIGIARLLLDAGVDVGLEMGATRQCSDTGSAAIAEAAFKLNTDMVTLLLQYGVDPSAEADGNTNPLANAVLGSILEGKPGVEMVKILLNAGADLNNYCRLPKEFDVVLPGSLLAVATQSRSPELVQLLLDSGADVNWRSDLDNWTALQCAITSGSDDIVNLILEAGADVNAEPSTQDGRTALQAAASHGNLDLVRLLLRNGADVNAAAARVRGVTALQAASIRGHFSVVVQLLHVGADIHGEASDTEGRTALQGAAQWGRLDVVSLLLENDHQVQGFYDRCRDAAGYADSGRHPIIKELLLNYRKP